LASPKYRFLPFGKNVASGLWPLLPVFALAKYRVRDALSRMSASRFRL
jgi:hypothetical protein